MAISNYLEDIGLVFQEDKDGKTAIVGRGATYICGEEETFDALNKHFTSFLSLIQQRYQSCTIAQRRMPPS